tara:strand:- start:1095 stop:1295 length:201 start_codon:yes stop_codon:yes gene_type:complete
MAKRECPHCFEQIDSRAKLCPHCNQKITDHVQYEKKKQEDFIFGIKFLAIFGLTFLVIAFLWEMIR